MEAYFFSNAHFSTDITDYAIMDSMFVPMCFQFALIVKPYFFAFSKALRAKKPPLFSHFVSFHQLTTSNCGHFRFKCCFKLCFRIRLHFRCRNNYRQWLCRANALCKIIFLKSSMDSSAVWTSSSSK